MMPDAIAALYDAEMTETADELSERLKEEGAFDHRPDWHRRPTCPGRWLVFENGHAVVTTWRTQKIFDWWQQKVRFSDKCLYYGPIPDPPEEVR